MLSDRHCQLLSAYVDGELSEREHQSAQRLLQQSREAHALLKELQDNAAKIKALPPRPPGLDLSPEILGRIEGLQPATIRMRRTAASGIPTWVGAAAAAAVLLMVTGVSYWFFKPAKPSDEIAIEVKPGPPTPPAPPILVPEEKVDRSPLIASLIQGTVTKFGESGLHVNVLELAQEQMKSRLTSQLKSDSSIHMELDCKNSAQAVAGLNEVLQKNGVKVVVDAVAQAKLLAKPKTEILVYAENLTAEELAEIFKQLGTMEMVREPGERQLKSMHVDTLTPLHRTELAKLFGVDAKQLRPPPKQLGKFIPAVQIAKNNKDKGEPPPRPDKLAMVIANEAGQNPAASAELQQFLQNRRRTGQQPGTLQVILVLRPASA